MVKTFRAVQQWDHWLTQYLGARVLESEQRLLARIYAEHYGKHTALIGVPQQHTLLNFSVIAHRVLISPLTDKDAPAQLIESEFYELPVVPGSMDLVILPHTLEYIDNPHRLLIEACRIVKPEGNITILGFNPSSLWGLKKYLTKNNTIPWDSHFISKSKLIKWLKLLDFQIVQQHMLMFRPPVSQAALFQKLEFLEWVGCKCFAPFGGIYTLTAKAKMIPLTPIKLHWKQKLSPLSVSITGPTLRDRQ